MIALHAEGLASMGHAVRVVSPPRRPMPLRRRIKSLATGKGWPPGLLPRTHFDGRKIEHRVLDRSRPVTDEDVPPADVVVATWWETAEWVSKLHPSKGAKVYFIQGHEVFPNLPVARCRATYRLPMHKIVVSRWLADIMRVEYGDDAVDIVPNSVDTSHFFAERRGKQPDPTVGFLYATGPIKGVDACLAAIASVRRQFTRVRVVSFGAERPIPVLRLPEGCEFSFAPAQSDIRGIYGKCDAWISASRSEGFNLTVAEAMACRTPVVATRTGWPAHAVETGRNGVLVDVDDHEGLAEGLAWVLSRSDEDWRRLSAHAHATANASSWQESTAAFASALERACERARRGEIAGARAPAAAA